MDRSPLLVTEQYRHECEVREVSTWSRERILGFLERVRQKRTLCAYEKLLEAVQPALKGN